MASSPTRTERIELRAQPEAAQRLRQAARLRGQTLSAFMLDAAGEAAEEVLVNATTTAVAPGFFDKLWTALDEPPRPNAALTRRASARRRVKQR